ncbi:SusC/RagA family TonB-linked outer membrane protein [Macellibacteroides fermentans]|uniref:TonB-linked outer membrane protein, SusC/RagA family n=1 Tax=Parabacteroides chartae TaxID=1037355 RepID=A0A1T5AG81_9BACT|nr:TonB-dependent receptor [Parabacteroides chartae]SKB33643.1 TonB-linked outer membrane protein, SusC/RagA family [Parabacteroides chartae]
MKKLNHFYLLFVLLLFSLSIAAQEYTITGVVTDHEGLTIPGASVSVKNTTRGTITDLDGKYSIAVSKGEVLIYSFVGYKPQEQSIADSRPVNIKLSISTVGLDEVVVVGYGTQSRRTITSAITKVGGEALKNIPISTVGEGLKGKIAGARLYSNNNTPGADVTIRIRGGSSINKSNDPLILVDGVERAFSGINPNDIESIEILKDAASTAIYGSRASNGVVLITTKKGDFGKKANITFEANLAMQEPETLYDFMNAEDYLRTVRPAVAIGPNSKYNQMDGYSASSGNTASSIYSTRYLKDGETVPAGYKSMIDPIDPTKTLIFQDNNFQDEIYKKALWQNYYVGIDGGNDGIKYSSSIGYTDDGGVALATGFQRLSMRSAMDIKINEHLNFASGFDYSKTDSEEYSNQMNVISRGLATPPTQKKYNDDGTPTKGYNATSPNPIWYKYYNDQSTVDKRLSAYGKLTYRIIDGLKADVQLSTYNHHSKDDSFMKANEFNGLRPTTSSFGELNRNKLEAYGTYNKSILDHSFSVMAGYSYQRDKNQALSASVTGASSDKVPTLTAGPDKTDATSSFTEDVTIGYFGRLSYDFKKKYLFSATFREDASSRFASGHQWGFFPGASAGWVVSDESFMKNIKNLDNLKLRVSYGQTGNNSIGLYDAYGKYSTSAKYNGIAGIVPSTMPNTELTWEVSTQLDAGFDLSIFNNRLSISGDYFNKITDNLLFSKELPNTSGFSNVQTNIGKVKFYGFDIEVSSTNIQTKDFSWSSKLTWSFVKNKVLKLPDNGREKNRIGGITLADGTSFGGTAEGESLYSYYGYVVDHIIETQEEADNAIYDSKAKGYRFSDKKKIAGRKEIGDYEWKNRDGSLQRNGKDYIDDQDQFLLGYTVPTSTGGLNNSFSYKNFNLNIFLDWALGHSIQNSSEMRYFMNTFANNYTLIDEVKECWSKPGDNTKYARFTANDPDDGNSNFSRSSNVFNYKGDYLCIREVSLQYNVPSSKLGKFGIQNLAFTLSGNNLHYFTAVKGVSPEVGTSTTYNSSYYNYPPIRRFSAGIKVTF